MENEWQLLVRARRGDDSAWGALQKLHGRQLWQWLFFRCADEQTARDIYQETWLRMLQVTPRHERGALGRYLFVTARRLLWDHRRRETRWGSLAEESRRSPETGPLESTVALDRRQWLQRAVAELPEAQREVLLLRFYGERSYEEMAVILEIPLGTVKSRMSNALARCREFLKKHGVTL